MSAEKKQTGLIDAEFVNQLVELYFAGEPQVRGLIDPSSDAFYMARPEDAAAWKIVQEQMKQGRKIEKDISKW